MSESQALDSMPPKGMIIQSLNEAHGRLVSILGRFLDPSFNDSASDSLSAEESYVYELRLSLRKSSNKAKPMADLIHSYMVNSALTKLYSSMSQAELAGKHDAQATSDAQVIDQMLHSKLPPI